MRRVDRTVVLIVALAGWLGCAGAAEKYKGFARGEALIDVAELRQRLDAGDPRLIVLAVAEPLSFQAGHIPGAINVWRGDYDAPVGQPHPFEGMLLDAARFQQFARAVGVNNDSRVVVYDEKYDATRLWWAFFLYGKTDVRVLDGGYPAWQAAGYATEAALGRGRGGKAGNFVARPWRGTGWLATTADVRQAGKAADVQVWDAREAGEWSGAEHKGSARRAGRVPWARFQNWREFKTETGGKPTAFRSADEVRAVIARFGMDPAKRQVFYCQSGVRSTTAVFVLYLMGWDPGRLYNYDGSWLEWSYHDENPVVAGP